METSCVVLRYTVIKLHIIKASKFFSVRVGLFLNFRKIEPTVSDNLFVIRKMSVLCIVTRPFNTHFMYGYFRQYFLHV